MKKQWPRIKNFLITLKEIGKMLWPISQKKYIHWVLSSSDSMEELSIIVDELNKSLMASREKIIERKKLAEKAVLQEESQKKKVRYMIN